MYIFRFFENVSFIINNCYSLSSSNSHKIINVLRLGLEDKICLFNDTNHEFIASIIQVKSRLVIIKIIQASYKNIESSLKIHLAQSIATKEHMDFIIQKATELGVYQITPIITHKSKIRLKTQKIKQEKQDHWKNIAINACCQCGRNRLPLINNLTTFDDWISMFINQAKNLKYKFMLSPVIDGIIERQANINTNEILANPSKEIILFIGSESGFTSIELELAIKANFSILNLGPRILRTETAALAAVSIFQFKYGDLRFD